MQPGDLYVLGIVVTALFVAPFNGLARVIVLAWIVTHVGFMFGAPERAANIAGQIGVLILGKTHRRSVADKVAWALSIVLLGFNIGGAAGIITPWVTWWAVLLIAIEQLMIMSMAVDGSVAHAVTRVWRESGSRGMFRMGARETIGSRHA